MSQSAKASEGESSPSSPPAWSSSDHRGWCAWEAAHCPAAATRPPGEAGPLCWAPGHWVGREAGARGNQGGERQASS